MEAYQSAHSAYYYANPEVQLTNISYDSNNYFASFMNSHVGVASYNDTRYVTSANTFIKYHDQEPMSTVNYLSFNATSDIQHVNLYSSAISSQYVVPP